MTRKKRLRRDNRKYKKLEANRPSDSPALVTAHDYRAQQQAKVGKKPHGFPSDLLTKKAFQHLKQFFPDLKKHEFISEFRQRGYKLDTEWDDPLSHSLLLDIKRQIEKSCHALGYSLHDGVSVGILQAEATEAMQQSVMLTETSVIMMTGNLQMLIHRAAKLLALTVPFQVINNNQFKMSESLFDAIALANRSEKLRRDWANLFIDYAAAPGTPNRGDVVIVTGLERQTIWEDISNSMSLFVVGHEYAHHILKHSLSGSASASGLDADLSHRMEHEADILGLLISMRAGHDETPPNIFASFGVGAAVILTVIEYCRHGAQLLAHGVIKDESRSTHPPLQERLECLAQVVPEIMKPYGPDQTEVVRSFHGMFVGIVQNAWDSAKDVLLKAHNRGERPIYRDDGGWLPGRGIAKSTVPNPPLEGIEEQG